VSGSKIKDNSTTVVFIEVSQFSAINLNFESIGNVEVPN